MALESDSKQIRLSGQCPAEDAETLLAWLLDHPGGRIDIAGVEHMHAAVFQVLAAARETPVSGPPSGFYPHLLSVARTRKGSCR